MAHADTFRCLTEILSPFARIVSLQKQYSDALAPYQEKATPILAAIESGETATMEETEPAIEKMLLLLESISIHVLDTGEAVRLLDSIGKSYPIKVYQGITDRA